jgi:hypothetical protein
MVNLVANLNKFLSELQSHFPRFYNLSEDTNGTLIISVAHEVICDGSRCRPFVLFLLPLIRRLRLTEYISQKILGGPNIPELKGASVLVGVEYHIDRTSLYINQLKEYFSPTVTKADVAKAIGFLMEHGWAEREFQNEIGLSRASLYRYQSEIEKS